MGTIRVSQVGVGIFSRRGSGNPLHGPTIRASLPGNSLVIPAIARISAQSKIDSSPQLHLLIVAHLGNRAFELFPLSLGHDNVILA